MLGAILIGRVVKRLDPEEECNDLTFKPKRMHWTTYKTDATARSALCCRHIVGRGSVPQGSPRAPQPEADLKLGSDLPQIGDVKFRSYTLNLYASRLGLFHGEPPNPARTMNVRGTANASASGGTPSGKMSSLKTAHLVTRPGPRPTRNDYPAIERSRARLS